MPLPVSTHPIHRNLVLNLYRRIIQNALNLPMSNIENHQFLLNKIRKKFRTNSNFTNSLQIQNCLRDGVSFNNRLVNAYDNIALLDSLFLTPKKQLEEKTTEPNLTLSSSTPTPPSISNKIRKNPDYSELTDDEILEFRSTREFDLPDSTKLLLPNIKIHAEWYLNSESYPKIKDKLNKRYLHNILPSAIAHKKHLFYLNRLKKKLSSGPTHKLKRISGTGHWIYVINTPWNKNLRTENFKFIYDIRKKYDNYILKTQEFENYKSKHLKLSDYEKNWEILINLDNTSNDSDYSWIYETSEKSLKLEKYQIEKAVVDFCKRQGLIYKKIKPLFDEFHNTSTHNMELLNNHIENSQVGPFSDIVDNGLGNILKTYGFRDPLESRYMKKENQYRTNK